ncbi:MAG: hypothetical protein PHT07_04820 [Paludibacter sp.]|nr:hypothetical protein [Paludibacter sp.]
MNTHKINSKLRMIFFLAFGCIFTTIASQNTHQINQMKEASLDTISYIKIEKTIFYKDPLVMEYSSLTDTTYIPEWYNAFCACYNINHFKDFSKDAIKFYHSDCGVTELILNYC